MPKIPKITRRQALAASLALCPMLGSAQSAAFPSKPIKVLIGVPAGGTQDILTRALADAMRGSLGTLVLEHRAGAAGRIAAEAVKNAEPDGHTLLLGPASVMSIFPSAYGKLGYDPIGDFAPIVNAASFELALVVHHSVPANNLAEFIAWAKTQGSKVSFASYGAGTPSHFLGEMLNRAAGLQMLHVPYRGSTPARQDVMGGSVQAYFDTVGGAISMQPTGRVKVLATSGAKRSPPMPGVPTFTELGYPAVQASAWFAYFAPVKTPKPILDKLRAEFMKAVNTREVRQQLLLNGMYPVGDDYQQLARTLQADTARWAKIVQAANFKAAD